MIIPARGNALQARTSFWTALRTSSIFTYITSTNITTGVSPENSMQGMLGVVVTREEFEKGLLRASGGTAWESLSDDETSEIEMTREYFFGRVLATPDDCGFPVFGVENAFRTDRFRFLTVLTLLCCDVERRYEKLFAFLQDDISKSSRQPTR